MCEDAPRALLGGRSTADRRRQPNLMDRFIDTIELIAAIFVGIVAADTFLIVVLRYFFSIGIPDSYDFGQLLLGILIFWGIAATSYRGAHITVDLVWANASPRWQRVDRRVRHAGAAVRRHRSDLHAVRQGGFDLRLQSRRRSSCGCRPGRSSRIAWLGDAAAVLLIAVRTYRLIFHPELLARRQISGQRVDLNAVRQATCRPTISPLGDVRAAAANLAVLRHRLARRRRRRAADRGAPPTG